MSTSKYITCALNIQSFYRKVPPTLGFQADAIKQVEHKRWNERVIGRASHDDTRDKSISTPKSWG